MRRAAVASFSASATGPESRALMGGPHTSDGGRSCAALAVAAGSDALDGQSHALGRPEARWDLLSAGEAEKLIKRDRLGIRDDVDPGRATLARDPHRVLDERASHPRAHAFGLDEQAIEFACALRGLEQHGEANDVCAQLGDAHETVLDLVEG
jgi:hypothetical protein